MKKLLCITAIFVGICGYGNAMQRGVILDSHAKEAISPFVFIEKTPKIEAISGSRNSIWSLIQGPEEDVEDFLSGADLSNDNIKELELKFPRTEEALENAFFGNEKLSREFLTLKKHIVQTDKLSDLQINQLSWLVQNQRGDHECAKMLTTFYKFKKEMVMHLFWRHVALFFHLPVGDL